MLEIRTQQNVWIVNQNFSFTRYQIFPDEMKTLSILIRFYQGQAEDVIMTGGEKELQSMALFQDHRYNILTIEINHN